mmetsp:Transcript_137957/g.311038  ORF Transcript_137957/g.311038 Transcript_137957/m.311038 type:complete len:229 (-) Transcript_137957:349-1035(-)
MNSSSGSHRTGSSPLRNPMLNHNFMFSRENGPWIFPSGSMYCHPLAGGSMSRGSRSASVPEGRELGGVKTLCRISRASRSSEVSSISDPVTASGSGLALLKLDKQAFEVEGSNSSLITELSSWLVSGVCSWLRRSRRTSTQDTSAAGPMHTKRTCRALQQHPSTHRGLQAIFAATSTTTAKSTPTAPTVSRAHRRAADRHRRPTPHTREAKAASRNKTITSVEEFWKL